MVLDDSQRASLALWYVVNASLSSYYKLIHSFETAEKALTAGVVAWQELSIHKAHLARLEDKDSIKAFLHYTQENIDKKIYGVLFEMPESLANLYDPPPVLFYRGNKDRLFEKSLAIVGTRTPSDYAQKLSFDLAQYLVQAGYVITSGLALGVDSFAHRGALAQTDPALFGRTVGVMGTGIDVCYPPKNQGLFFDIIQSGGCLVSELLPATPASKHTFPRRNRLVAGLSMATIVTEASLQSGSLISAKLTSEQGKQVFALPNRVDCPNTEGCHYLIREGATLIYHPDQILEDLNHQFIKPAQAFLPHLDNPVADDEPPAILTPPTPDIPPHLSTIYHLLDEPKDLDKLVELTALSAGDLLAKLTELEIYGFVKSFGGRYAKL